MTTGTAALNGGGNTFKAFGVSKTVTLATDYPLIDATGVTDTSVRLQQAINNTPDGSRIIFQNKGTYRCESSIVINNRHNLLFDMNGATLKATQPGPPGQNIIATDVTIEADGIHLTSASNPWHALYRSPYSWYISGTGIPSSNRVSFRQYIDDGHIFMEVPPGTAVASAFRGPNKTVTLRSPLVRGRSSFQVSESSSVHFQNGGILGPNPGSVYDPQFEGQHAFDVSGTNDIEISNMIIRTVWGDGVSLSFSEANGKQCSNVYIHGNYIFNVGRHGMTLTGCTDLLFCQNNIPKVGRHIVDCEPPDPLGVVLRINIMDNDLGAGGTGLIACSTYGAVNTTIGNFTVDGNRISPDSSMNMPFGNQLTPITPRWGPFTITNNAGGHSYGTGVSGQTNTSWSTIPAVLKFQYADKITVTGNVLNIQGGRSMYGVWAQFSSIVEVHDNDFAATDAAHEFHVVKWPVGTASLTGGATFAAVGANVAPNKGTGSLQGGGSFVVDTISGAAVFGTASVLGGGTFTIKILIPTSAALSGGGTFSALVLPPSFTAHFGGSFAVVVNPQPPRSVSWRIGGIALGGAGFGFGSGDFGSNDFGGNQ